MPTEGFRPTHRAAHVLAKQPRGTMSAYVNRAIACLADFEDSTTALQRLALQTEAQRRNLTLGEYLGVLAAPVGNRLLMPPRQGRR
jgi:hypothetical protein